MCAMLAVRLRRVSIQVAFAALAFFVSRRKVSPSNYYFCAQLYQCASPGGGGAPETTIMIRLHSYQFAVLLVVALLLFFRSEIMTALMERDTREPLPPLPRESATGRAACLTAEHPAGPVASVTLPSLRAVEPGPRAVEPGPRAVEPGPRAVVPSRPAPPVVPFAVSPDWACGASFTPASAARAEIALAVQGSGTEVQAWIDLHATLEKSARVTLFVLPYDGPLASAECSSGRVRCLHLPGGSTWTTGRNALAQSIFDAELAQGAPFRYWAFSDADQILMACTVACVELGVLAVSKCCMDRLLARLFEPLDFSALGVYYTDRFDPEHAADLFHRHDCPDAQFYAVHRDAVPVLLPYFTDIDHLSWWSSQAILYRIAGSCLRGGGVTVHLSGDAPAVHKSYPAGRFIPEEDAVLQAAFPGLIPWPLRLDSRELGDCGDVRNSGWVRFNATVPGHVQFAASWKTTREYATCLAETQPRFCGTMRSAPPLASA
jgi:hypothetical protein